MESRGAEQDRNVYLFGPFRFAPAKQRLTKSGRTVRVGARALDILTLLLRRHGEPVSKAELLDFVWPGTFIHESNLKVNVAALRRALSDTASDAEYVVSVPRRGYRFVGSVETIPETSATTARQALAIQKTLPSQPIVIGRSAEMSSLADMLSNGPCVSVVGPGGVGKTTIAVAVAHRIRDNYQDGICFVDLATIVDPQYVDLVIANAVGARRSDDDPISGVINVLQGRRVLLVFDNCEHLTSTVARTVVKLLAALPGITVFATSREPLEVTSEQLYRLPTFEVPPDSSGITVDHALTFPSVELFVTRADQHGGYDLTERDAPLVSAICQRLDGIALAIELAASKAAAFGVPKLLSMLEHRFPLLSHGPRDAPLRHQTLQATLDWSFKLLSDDEASLLKLLSVFVGTFHLADAVAMSPAARLEPPQTINALERLTARSLVTVEHNGAVLRYRLLESTRAYATEKLMAEAEYKRAMSIYAQYMLVVFERGDAEWRKREKAEWVAEYAPKIHDLRKVLSWAFGEDGNKKLGIALTAMAIPLWEELSLVSEFRARVDAASAAIREVSGCPIAVRMKLAWSRASGMNFAQPLKEETGAAWLRCYELGVEGASVEYQLRGLWGLAIYLVYIGRSDEAIDRLRQFTQVAEVNGEWWAVPEGERLLAMAEIYVGQFASARQRLEALLARYEADQGRVRNTRYNLDQLVAIKCSLALVLWLTGEPGRATQVIREAVDRAERIDHIISRSNLLALGAIPITFWSGEFRTADHYQALLEEDGRREYIEIWARIARFFKAALRAKQAGVDGLKELNARLEELVEWGFTMRAPMYYCTHAEVLLASGQLDEARDSMSRARHYLQSPGEKWCSPEVNRVDAMIRLRAGDLAGAEMLLVEAIQDSQATGAVTLEARAGLVLAEMLQASHRTKEALSVLDGIYRRLPDKASFDSLVRTRTRYLKMVGAPAG